jgi:hypothetical protein
MRCGSEYAAVTIASSPKYRDLYTTDPQERKELREQARERETERAQSLV